MIQNLIPMDNTHFRCKKLIGEISSEKHFKSPMYVQPRIRGVRCLIHDGVAYSSNCVPFKNEYFQHYVKKHQRVLNGLDCVLVAGEHFYNISKSTHLFNQESTKFEFLIIVYDYFLEGTKPFRDRLAYLESLKLPDNAELCRAELVYSIAGLKHYIKKYEGKPVLSYFFRNPSSFYHHGFCPMSTCMEVVTGIVIEAECVHYKFEHITVPKWGEESTLVLTELICRHEGKDYDVDIVSETSLHRKIVMASLGGELIGKKFKIRLLFKGNSDTLKATLIEDEDLIEET